MLEAGFPPIQSARLPTPCIARHGVVIQTHGRRRPVIAGRIGKWLATGLIAATAVNALAQLLAGCRMHAADAAPAQTASSQQDDRPCHGRGAEVAVASGHETAPAGHTELCVHAGSCACCATGVCGGGHPALSIGSMFLAAYDPGTGRAPRIPWADAPRSVYFDPPLRPPATQTLYGVSPAPRGPAVALRLAQSGRTGLPRVTFPSLLLSVLPLQRARVRSSH